MSTGNSHEAPFQMHLEQDDQGRISRKVEYVAGRDPRVRNYEYDEDRQLTAVSDGNRETESYEYDGNGHRIAATWYEPEVESQNLVYQEHYSGDTRLCAINNRSVYHDDNGFRESWYPHSGEEHYEYAPDYRLLKITKTGPDRQPMTLEFDQDHNGQRCEKYENGQLVELYDWHDLIRLASAKSHGQELEFHYRDGERTPAACTYNGEHLLYLYYDQVGSLRVVADEYGNVLKEVRYTAFGVIEEDTNPGLYMPIGFAGGLHDRDINWVRFGYRDYDPLTARFTAKDPMGYAAGDSDLRGYCFDDPVNGIDPLGLEGMSWGGDGRRLVNGPKIGNYCGKNWTGGQNPENHDGQAGVAPPVSSMDERCEDHDYCYRESPNDDHKQMCNEALVKSLKQLPDDLRSWLKPPPEGTERDNKLMKKGAIEWFD